MFHLSPHPNEIFIKTNKGELGELSLENSESDFVRVQCEHCPCRRAVRPPQKSPFPWDTKGRKPGREKMIVNRASALDAQLDIFMFH